MTARRVTATMEGNASEDRMEESAGKGKGDLFLGDFALSPGSE